MFSFDFSQMFAEMKKSGPFLFAVALVCTMAAMAVAGYVVISAAL